MLRTCGVVLRPDQAYLVDSRLAPVAKLHGLARAADFVTKACAAPAGSALSNALIDAMTTHETLFFRDPPFWRYLEDQLVPKLAAKLRAGGGARIWSAACSTGQEPYSLAMMFEERCPDVAPHLEIIATDVSELAVGQGKMGTYTTLEVNRGLSAPRLIRHFDQGPASFRVREPLRRRITWSVHNLLGSKPDPTGCDLVLCRNVLIYFGETDRAEVTRRLTASAAPGGIVGIGSTETLRGTQLAPGLYVKAG
jgi:chemotaxis protein methyltransferase CheR